jgi:hypothetical protein
MRTASIPTVTYYELVHRPTRNLVADFDTIEDAEVFARDVLGDPNATGLTLLQVRDDGSKEVVSWPRSAPKLLFLSDLDAIRRAASVVDAGSQGLLTIRAFQALEPYIRLEAAAERKKRPPIRTEAGNDVEVHVQEAV